MVGEIGEELGIPGSTLSHHLEKLKNEDLVSVRREGTYLRYAANSEALEELLAFLYAECCSRSKAVEPDAITRSLQDVLSPKPVSAGRSETMSDIKDAVKEKYGKAALRVTATQGTSCCGPSCCSSVPGAVDPITVNLYDQKQTEGLPAEAVLASLGCGNPTALARLNPGEVVLDLGSGGGIDVLLSAKRVGPTGKAYGLDMTDEMLNLARENQRKAGVRERRVPEGARSRAFRSPTTAST